MNEDRVFPVFLEHPLYAAVLVVAVSFVAWGGGRLDWPALTGEWLRAWYPFLLSVLVWTILWILGGIGLMAAPELPERRRIAVLVVVSAMGLAAPAPLVARWHEERLATALYLAWCIVTVAWTLDRVRRCPLESGVGRNAGGSAVVWGMQAIPQIALCLLYAWAWKLLEKLPGTKPGRLELPLGFFLALETGVFVMWWSAMVMLGVFFAARRIPHDKQEELAMALIMRTLPALLPIVLVDPSWTPPLVARGLLLLAPAWIVGLTLATTQRLLRESRPRT